VYVKEKEKEYLLIFDSLGDMEMAEVAALASPEIDVYTSINKIRQRDSYSCHAEAMIFIRELAGKNEKNNFIIQDISHKLAENVMQKDNPDSPPRNLYKVKLFDSLLLTIQNPPFKEEHKQQYASKAVVHIHKGEPEQIGDF